MIAMYELAPHCAIHPQANALRRCPCPFAVSPAITPKRVHAEMGPPVDTWIYDALTWIASFLTPAPKAIVFAVNKACKQQQ